MRIVALADTHTFEQDLGQIPDGDVFVHAGDLLRGGTLEELAAPARWIRELPHKHKLVVAGNHDWCFVRDRQRALDLLGDGVIYLQDTGCDIEGLSFWGAPWQPAFNDWAFNLPRGPELAARWSLIPEHCQVLITHGPPAGFGDRSGMSARAGCSDLLAACQRVQPLLHLFGHIHQDGGVHANGKILHVNVTSWECERGATVIDIDTGSGTVTPAMVPIRDPLHPD